MITTYDTEDLDRAAAAMRKRFHFIPTSNDQMAYVGNAGAKRYREQAERKSREAAEAVFESMGLTRV